MIHEQVTKRSALRTDVEIDPNAQNKSGNTALHLAARLQLTAKTEQLIKKLVERGGNLDLNNDLGETAIFSAVSRQHAPTVHLLLLLGASSDVTNKKGETPLDWARKGNNIEILNSLQNSQKTQNLSAVLVLKNSQIVEQQRLIQEQASQIRDLVAQVASLRKNAEANVMTSELCAFRLLIRCSRGKAPIQEDRFSSNLILC
jgi:ankyrin repeat protein